MVGWPPNARRFLWGRDGLKLSVIWTQRPRWALFRWSMVAEYKERYIPLIERLAALGYACAACDHRGHGESVGSRKDLGYVGENGLETRVGDLKQVFEHGRARWPGVPAFLLGPGPT